MLLMTPAISFASANSARSSNAATKTPLYPTILTSPNAQSNGAFGESVAVSGNSVVVGADSENASNLQDAGNAYVIYLVSGAVTTLSSPNAQTNGFFGSSVAISGNTVVVGAPYETASGFSRAGHAYIFSTSGSFIATLTSPNAQSYGFFGSSVAISGTTVVVGADYEKVSGAVGAGNVYTFNATTGDLIETIPVPNPQFDAYFGGSVSISGTTIAVGAPSEYVTGNDFAGSAFTFNAATGNLIKTFTSPNTQSYGYFGQSVGISGGSLVIGAPNENVSGEIGAGRAYIFNSNSGKLVKTLQSPNTQVEAFFGNSVSINGTEAAVGAYNETISGHNLAGQAYTFSSTGKLINTLTSPNAEYYGEFGYSVAVSGTTVVVGAQYETASAINYAGHVYAYESPPAALSSSTPEVGGHFGWSVALSGTTVVVGAPLDGISGESEAGNAYIFNGATGNVIALTSPNMQNSGLFGISVAISGATVVGAYGETASGDGSAGHVYTFNATTGTLIKTLKSPNPESDGDFGYSVAISGTTIVVGAPEESVSGLAAAGHVYTFSSVTGKLIKTFTSPNAQSGGYFGASLAINGTIVAAGAPDENASGYSYAGHAYTFNSTTGALIETFKSPKAQSSGAFGYSVAVSGKTIVVGAPGENSSKLIAAGNAYTFGAASGKLIKTLKNADPIENGYFGDSVAMNSTTAVVGAPNEIVGGIARHAPNAGRAFAFNAKTGSSIENYSSLYYQTDGNFGSSVAVGSTLVVVGANGEYVFGDSEAGHAYVF